MGQLSKRIRIFDKKYYTRLGILLIILACFFFITIGFRTIKTYIGDPKSLEFIGNYSFSATKATVKTGSDYTYYLTYECNDLDYTVTKQVEFEAYKAARDSVAYNRDLDVFKLPDGSYYTANNLGETPEQAAKEYKKELVGNDWFGLVMSVLCFIAGIVCFWNAKRNEKGDNSKIEKEDYSPFY